MIKKYNQFVNENKTNEEFDFETETPVRKIPSLGKPVTPEVAPDTTVKPGEAPSKPSPFRRDKPSTEPGPKAELEGEEEEVGIDKYTAALQSLADAAGVDFNPSDKMVIINGKEVTFPAEDEKYHIKGVRKGFNTVDDVLANVGGENKTIEPSIKDEEAFEEEPSFEETEGDLAKRDLESEMGALESKSYKSTRLKKFKV
jgi:hypothetical protein